MTLAEITAAVAERSDGRNRECWPVLSFGGRDADLEPGGCTGIKALAWKDDDTLLVSVGGHKMFAFSEPDELDGESDDDYAARAESIREAETDFLMSATSGYGVEGGEDGIYLSFEDAIEVSIAHDTDGEMAATVDAVIKAAEKCCDEFENAMREITEGQETK